MTYEMWRRCDKGSIVSFDRTSNLLRQKYRKIYVQSLLEVEKKHTCWLFKK